MYTDYIYADTMHMHGERVRETQRKCLLAGIQDQLFQSHIKHNAKKVYVSQHQKKIWPKKMDQKNHH